MPIDIYGPASSLNAVTARPSDGRFFTSLDSFFKDCTTPSSQDGTQVTASWLNQVTGTLRAIARVNGLKLDGINPVIPYDQGDAMGILAIEQLIQRGQLNLGVDHGAVNALAVTLSPTPAELIDGMSIVVKVSATNTATSVTLTLIGLSTTAYPVVKQDGTALAIGDLFASGFFAFRYYASAGQFRVSGLLKSDLSVTSTFISSLTSNSTFITQVEQQLPPGATLINAYLTAGSGVWTNPGLRKILLKLLGGGAGGSSGTTVFAGGGGGSGAYSEGVVDVSALSSVPYINGAGGAGAPGSNQFGSPGGSTSFGSLTSAAGAPILTTGSFIIPSGQPGAPVGSTGSFNLPGNGGGDGAVNNSIGGNGGGTLFGTGGRAGILNGVNGSSYGVGGGGAYNGGSGGGGGTPGTGGNGAPGAILIFALQ